MTNLSESRFWDKFIYKTTSYNIKPGVARWYVRHAESYIKSNKTRLATHMASDVEKYLTEKCRSQFLQDWQLRQIIIALRILFTGMVNVPWGKEFPWDAWIDKSKALEISHPTVARDFISADIKSIEKNHFEKNSSLKVKFKKIFDLYLYTLKTSSNLSA